MEGVYAGRGHHNKKVSTGSDDKAQAKLREALVLKGQYKRALANLDKCLEKRPDQSLYRERAHLHLYVGEAGLERRDFDTTAALSSEQSHTPSGKLHSDSEHNGIGVTYWIEGRRELATAFWRYTTNSLSANRVAYSHMGGGIEAGLLLWFGAVHTKKQEDIELVRRFYKKREMSTFWSHSLSAWPGPIVRYFLKQIDESRLLEIAAGKHQARCQAHFAAAIRSREVGRHATYKKYLRLAAKGIGPTDVYDFYNVFPFFLARFEVLPAVT
ncbi:MAG TPA: hypothetical protein VFE47_28820 [Tepidisphaeraceae bacterium]|nr:hypothetical protein [Tepidisphaeraceae bacterium]